MSLHAVCLEITFRSSPRRTSIQVPEIKSSPTQLKKVTGGFQVGLTLVIAQYPLIPSSFCADNRDSFVYREAARANLDTEKGLFAADGARGKVRGASWKSPLADAPAGVALEESGWRGGRRGLCRVFRHVRGWADQYCGWTPEAGFIQSVSPFHPLCPPSLPPLHLSRLRATAITSRYYTGRL